MDQNKNNKTNKANNKSMNQANQCKGTDKKNNQTTDQK